MMRVRSSLGKLSFFRLALAVCLGAFEAVRCLAGSAPQNPRTDELVAEAEEATRSGHFDVAEADYRKLLEVEPRSARLWSNLGAVRAMRGDCATALGTLARARAIDPKLYTPWYFGGYCELQLHRDATAFADLSRAVELNPQDANAWSLRARAAGNLERLGVAFASAVRGLETDPEKPDLYYQAGHVALDLATECYSRVVAAKNSTALMLELEGERDAGQGLWDLAIAAFRKALALAEDSPDLHFALGWVYFQSGKSSDAESEWRRCLQLAPDAAWAKVRLALVLSEDGKRSEADALLAALDAGDFEAREEFEDYLACARLLHRPELSERALARAMTYFPGDPELARWMTPPEDSGDRQDLATRAPSPSDAICLGVRFLVLSRRETPRGLAARFFRSGAAYGEFRRAFLREDVSSVEKILVARSDPLPTEAEEAFVLGQLLQWISYKYGQRLEASFPDSDPAQALVAENLLGNGQTQKAIEAYQALLTRKGNSPDILRALARAYWTEHEWSESLAILEKALAADPYDATTLVNVGRIYSYRQDWKDAERSFASAAKLEPRSSEAHLGWGETLRQEGRTQAALKELKIAEGLDPHNPRPHYILAQLYRKQNQKQMAEREMAVFQQLHSETALVTSRKTLEYVPLD